MTAKREDINQLCDIIRETSFAIHKYHRTGHLENIYENALVHRLKKQGINVNSNARSKSTTKTVRFWANTLPIF